MPYPAGGAQEEVRTKKTEEELATLFSRIQKHEGLLLVSTSGLVYPGAEDAPRDLVIVKPMPPRRRVADIAMRKSRRLSN